MTNAAFSAARVKLPDAPALVVGVRSAVWLSLAGEVETLSLDKTARRITNGAAPFLCHRKAAARRLAIGWFPALDLLELFAFVRPARFCIPTVRGLAETLLVTTPSTTEQEASALFASARTLLAELNASPSEGGPPIAQAMARGQWPWAPAVLTALGIGDPSPNSHADDGLRVWDRLPEWPDYAPQAPPDSWPVEPVEARARLVQLLGADRESRPQQMQYASHTAAAFAPREKAGEPRVVLAEAGTGVGKTLGYIAPATTWVQKNRGTVWISTYTRNLQRQLDRELDHALSILAAESSEGRRSQGSGEHLLPVEL